MEAERKLRMRCDCGSFFEEGIIKKKFEYPIMVCPKCNHRVFTVSQAKQYVRLERLYEMLKRKRKVIRIGNALGVTLPKVVDEFGIKEGMFVSFQAMGKKALKLVVG